MSVTAQVPPPPLPAATPLPPAPPKTGSPLAGFLIDVGLAGLILFGISLMAGLVWGLYRGVMVGMEAASQKADAPDPDAVAALLGQPGPLAQILMALVATGGAALILYFWRRPATRVERETSRHAAAKLSTWGWTLFVAVLVIIFSNGIAFLAKRAGIEPVPTNLDLMTRAVDQFPVFLMLFAVVLAPAYEELLFRRVLFGRLWQAGKPVLGMVLSSLAFALVHEIPGTSANGPAEIAQLWLIYGGMGAAFCWLYQRTGTLWAPIAAHALNNAVALSMLMLFGTH